MKKLTNTDWDLLCLIWGINGELVRNECLVAAYNKGELDGLPLLSQIASSTAESRRGYNDEFL